MHLTLSLAVAIGVFRWAPSILIGYRYGWLWGIVAFALLQAGAAAIACSIPTRTPGQHVELLGLVKLAGLGVIAITAAFLT